LDVAHRTTPRIKRDNLRGAEQGLSRLDLSPVKVSDLASVDQIVPEVESKLGEFFDHEWKQKTPGLFICGKPFRDFVPRSSDKYIFVPLRFFIANDEYLTSFFRMLETSIKADPNTLQTIAGHKPRTFLSMLWNALKFSPNWHGIGIDTKEFTQAEIISNAFY
jgi:hypothetical protein